MTQPASPKEVSGSLSSCDALQHTDRVTSLPGSPYHQLRHKRDEFSLQVNRVLTLVKELSSPSKPAAPRSRLARSTTTALPEEVVGTDGSDHLHKRAHSLPAALRSELPLDATVDTADSSADQYGSENQSPPGLPRVVAWCNPCFSSSPPKLEPDYQAAHWLRTQVHLDDLDKESPLLQHAQQHAESAAIQWRHPGAPAAERQPFVQRSSGTANRAAGDSIELPSSPAPTSSTSKLTANAARSPQQPATGSPQTGCPSSAHSAGPTSSPFAALRVIVGDTNLSSSGSETPSTGTAAAPNIVWGPQPGIPTSAERIPFAELRPVQQHSPAVCNSSYATTPITLSAAALQQLATTELTPMSRMPPMSAGSDQVAGDCEDGNRPICDDSVQTPRAGIQHPGSFTPQSYWSCVSWRDNDALSSISSIGRPVSECSVILEGQESPDQENQPPGKAADPVMQGMDSSVQEPLSQQPRAAHVPVAASAALLEDLRQQVEDQQLIIQHLQTELHAHHIQQQPAAAPAYGEVHTTSPAAVLPSACKLEAAVQCKSPLSSQDPQKPQQSQVAEQSEPVASTQEQPATAGVPERAHPSQPPQLQPAAKPAGLPRSTSALDLHTTAHAEELVHLTATLGMLQARLEAQQLLQDTKEAQFVADLTQMAAKLEAQQQLHASKMAECTMQLAQMAAQLESQQLLHVNKEAALAAELDAQKLLHANRKAELLAQLDAHELWRANKQAEFAAQLEAHTTAHSQTAAELDAKLADALAERDALRSQLDALRLQHDEDVASAAEGRQEAVSQLQHTVEHQTAQLQERSEECARQQLHLHQLAEENKTRQALLEEQRAERDKLQSQLQDAGVEHSKLESQLEAVSAQSSQLQLQLADADAESARLQRQLEVAGAENARLQCQLQEAGAECMQQQRCLGELEHELHMQHLEQEACAAASERDMHAVALFQQDLIQQVADLEGNTEHLQADLDHHLRRCRPGDANQWETMQLLTAQLEEALQQTADQQHIISRLQMDQQILQEEHAFEISQQPGWAGPENLGLSAVPVAPERQPLPAVCKDERSQQADMLPDSAAQQDSHPACASASTAEKELRLTSPSQMDDGLAYLQHFRQPAEPAEHSEDLDTLCSDDDELARLRQHSQRRQRALRSPDLCGQHVEASHEADQLTALLELVGPDTLEAGMIKDLAAERSQLPEKVTSLLASLARIGGFPTTVATSLKARMPSPPSAALPSPVLARLPAATATMPPARSCASAAIEVHMHASLQRDSAAATSTPGPAHPTAGGVPAITQIHVASPLTDAAATSMQHTCAPGAAMAQGPSGVPRHSPATPLSAHYCPATARVSGHSRQGLRYGPLRTAKSCPSKPQTTVIGFHPSPDSLRPSPNGLHASPSGFSASTRQGPSPKALSAAFLGAQGSADHPACSSAALAVASSQDSCNAACGHAAANNAAVSLPGAAKGAGQAAQTASDRAAAAAASAQATDNSSEAPVSVTPTPAQSAHGAAQTSSDSGTAAPADNEAKAEAAVSGGDAAMAAGQGAGRTTALPQAGDPASPSSEAAPTVAGHATESSRLPAAEAGSPLTAGGKGQGASGDAAAPVQPLATPVAERPGNAFYSNDAAGGPQGVGAVATEAHHAADPATPLLLRPGFTAAAPALLGVIDEDCASKVGIAGTSALQQSAVSSTAPEPQPVTVQPAMPLLLPCPVAAVCTNQPPPPATERRVTGLWANHPSHLSRPTPIRSGAPLEDSACATSAGRADQQPVGRQNTAPGCQDHRSTASPARTQAAAPAASLPLRRALQAVDNWQCGGLPATPLPISVSLPPIPDEDQLFMGGTSGCPSPTSSVTSFASSTTARLRLSWYGQNGMSFKDAMRPRKPSKRSAGAFSWGRQP